MMDEDLPSGWERNQLRETVHLNPESFDPEGHQQDTFTYIALSDVSNGHIQNTQTVRCEDAPSRARRRVRAGDVLIGTVRPPQRSHAIVPPELDGAVCSTGFSVVRCDKDINPYYLLSYVLSHDFFKQMMGFVAGSGYPAVKNSDVELMKTSNPPIPEQRKIASVLYTVDQAIKKTEAIIEQTERVKQGVMQRVFSEGYYNHEEFQEGNHRWPRLPAEWSFLPLHEVAETNPRYNKPNREVAYIEMDAVDTFLPQPAYVGQRNPQDYSGRMFHEHDTLFARITPCTENGKICFVEEIDTQVGIGSTELAVISPSSPDLVPKFLYHYTRTHRVRDYAISRMRGSTGRQRVPFSVFKKELHIPLPSEKEQEKIVDTLDSLDDKIRHLDLHKIQLQRLKRGIMQDLLTGEVQTKNRDIAVVDAVREVEQND